MNLRVSTLIRRAALAFSLATLGASPISAATDLHFQVLQFPDGAVEAGSKAVPVNILGDPVKEIVIVSGTTAHIYGLSEAGPTLIQQIQFPPSTSTGKAYFGFARLKKGPLRNLIYMNPDGVFYYPVSGDRLADSPSLLLKKPMMQGQSGTKGVQFCDLSLDLDGDGYDELLLPEKDGFSIYRHTEPMQFEPVELPKSPYKAENAFFFERDIPDDPTRAPSISASVVYRRGVDNLDFYDANGDNLTDLIYRSTGPGPDSKEVERYEVYLQKKGVTFESKPSQVMEIPYEPDVTKTFRDINRDGKLDVITVKSNIDVVNPRTVVKFYTAGPKSYQLFTHETDRRVTKDPIGLVRIGDFNGDGYTDFAMTFFSYQFGSAEDIVDLALASKLRFKLQFFLGQGGRGFNSVPDFEKELTLNTKAENFRGFSPVLLIDDMNGDHIMDLLLRGDDGKISVFPSQKGLSYAKDPSAEISAPPDNNIDVEDINGDGLADLIVSSVQKRMLTIYISPPPAAK